MSDCVSSVCQETNTPTYTALVPTAQPVHIWFLNRKVCHTSGTSTGSVEGKYKMVSLKNRRWYDLTSLFPYPLTTSVSYL